MTFDIGTHLVSPRIAGIYAHHGIYAGDDRVIHYSGFSTIGEKAPVAEATLADFSEGNPILHRKHPDAPYSGHTAISRARGRIDEDLYHLWTHKCEHFVYWVLYGEERSRQIDQTEKGLMRILSQPILQSLKQIRVVELGKVFSKVSSGAVNAGLAVIHCAESFKRYVDGLIDEEALKDEISHTAITAVSSQYYGVLVQLAIPVPVVGYLVGAFSGYFFAHVLHESGLLALGDTPATKAAKKRQALIHQLVQDALPVLRKNCEDLKSVIEQYYADRSNQFEAVFSELDKSHAISSDKLAVELDKICGLFGESLPFKSQAEFDDFMEDEGLILQF